MKTTIASAFITAVLLAGMTWAQEMPPMPKPQPEHAWLEKLTGEWDIEASMTPGPGQPVITSKGTESVKMLGGFWAVARHESVIMGTPMSGIMTLGYDVDRKLYVGTWVDSMIGYLWKYEGTLDEAGKVLTLASEGPCPTAPGKMSKVKEVVELTDADTRVFTSSMLGDDGKWQPMMKMTARRRK
jgi:Protein of unknown function (DUF1579)